MLTKNHPFCSPPDADDPRNRTTDAFGQMPRETSVLVVGAGPAGLALALTLTDAGVPHVVVDRLPAIQPQSRAAVIHAHTLEVLAPLGVTEALGRRGRQVTRFAIRDRDRALLRLRFDRLPSDYQGLLMVPQDETEQVLAGELIRRGGLIHRGVEARQVAPESVGEGEGGAVATVDTGGRTRQVRARFVVGADGMGSLVRQAAGIDFAGGTYEESFILADVAMDWPAGPEEVSLFFSPDGLVIVAPLPGDLYRVVATVDDAPPAPTVGDVQTLLDARGPARAPARVHLAVWTSRFRIHHRLAARYRSGPMFLAGDAAHVHSPAGGQGMNTGLVDAVVLGRLLADVVQGRRPAAALDLYEELRRPAAADVLSMADRLTRLATMDGAARRLVRNGLLAAVDLMPFIKRRMVRGFSGLGRRHLARLPD